MLATVQKKASGGKNKFLPLILSTYLSIATHTHTHRFATGLLSQCWVTSRSPLNTQHGWKQLWKVKPTDVLKLTARLEVSPKTFFSSFMSVSNLFWLLKYKNDLVWVCCSWNLLDFKTFWTISDRLWNKHHTVIILLWMMMWLKWTNIWRVFKYGEAVFFCHFKASCQNVLGTTDSDLNVYLKDAYQKQVVKASIRFTGWFNGW